MVSKFHYIKQWIGLGAALVALALSPPVPRAAYAASAANSAVEAQAVGDRLGEALLTEIKKLYPGASIGLDNQIHWSSGNLPEEFSGVTVRGETARGDLLFAVTDAVSHRESTGSIGFSAWVPARVALRRVHSGERLTDAMFTKQDINVATGPAREYRSVLLAPETSLGDLQARQTVIEGQFLVSSAVDRVPDVRRGDSVSVHVISNGLSLSTMGTAEEPGYLDGQVRVMASRTKRELVGKLVSTGIVEVKL